MRRHVVIGGAKNARQLPLGHIEGAECNIEEWEIRSKILVPSLIRISVVPTMKDWADNNIAEWAKGPVQVRMHQKGHKRIERQKEEECLGTESDEADKKINQAGIKNEVEGMDSHRGQPIDMRWSMMNAMETP